MLSFYPLIEILKKFAGINEDDSETEQQEKLRSRIKQVHPEEAEEIFPFVGSLMGMNLTGQAAGRMRGIEGEALEKLSFKNLRELILKSSEQTTLIFIIEDLHWADTSSIELISSLFRLVENRKILFMSVFRPHYEETGDKLISYVKDNHPDLYVEISLRRLDVIQSDLLIDNLFRIEGLPVNIRDQIKKQSEGNPFFIEEVIRSFLDQGVIEIKNKQYVLTDKIGNVTVPNTIQELLMSRIDRLDESTKSLLKAASVIGRNFFHKLIFRVADNIKEINDKLEYLQDIQLVRQGKRMDEVEYLFKHALAQEITYESILMQKRKELHLQVAQAIESLFSDSLNEFYGVLATLYRWLRRIDDIPNSTQQPWNKTPESLTALVWRISMDNIDWGRFRISNQLKILNIFLAASTVRNILQRPKPKKASPTSTMRPKVHVTKNENGCRIPAWYPNHLWSIDLMEVYYLGLWKIYVLVSIDHFSRKVVAVSPLEGPSTGFVINALEAAFEFFGSPKHIITDHGSVFTSAAFREFIDSNRVKIRYGAIGEHRSIAVTERVIETLKYEWLKKLAIIRGHRHLVKLCNEFTEWYNVWRPHEFLVSATPTTFFRDKAVPFVLKNSKDLPANLEIKRFKETKTTAYRVKKAA